ncbi:MAG: hypothetical protein ACFCUM_19345 [Bacteroidales bacterium]
MKVTFLFCPARDRFALLLQQFNNEVDETVPILRQLKPAGDKSASIHRQFNSAKPFRVLFAILLSLIMFSSCTAISGNISGYPERETGMNDQSGLTGSAIFADGFHAQISSRLLNFTELYPQEKLYIHTDKSHYLPGETIWFKTYLTDASSHKASPWSRIVYVELVDESGEPAYNRNIEITEGTGHGDFFLNPEIRSGRWVLRGYTNYMLNYSNTPLFSMELKVINAYPGRHGFSGNAGSPAGSAHSSDAGSDAGSGSNRSAEMRLAEDTGKERTGSFGVQYFPEGGDLIAGLDVVVGVKITDTLGMGVDGRGNIYDDLGNFVTGFSGMGFGFGRFEFTTLPGRNYYGVIECDGLSERFDLPRVKEKGYALQINNNLSDAALIRVQTNEPAGLEGAFLIGHLRGQVFLLEAFEPGSQAFVHIDKTGFPAGIVHFTLFSKDGLPVSERLVFIGEEEASAHLDLMTSSDMFGRRESVDIKLEVRDHEGNPLAGDFSVSVTDSYVVPSFHERHNVETYLLLSSDLPGYIENPGFFFNSENPGRHVLLDLLMMTHGWRRFRWDDIIAENYPEIKYPAKSSHILSGKVTIKDQPNTPVRSRVMLSAIGDVFFAESMITDEKGNFYFDNLDFYDTTILVLQGDIQRERRAARRERRGIDDSFAAGYDNWVDFQLNEPDFGSGPVDIAAATVGEDVLRAYVEDSRKDPGLSHHEDIWHLDIEEVEVRARHIYDHPTFRRARHGRPMHGTRHIVDSIPDSRFYMNTLEFIGKISPWVYYDHASGSLRSISQPPVSFFMGGGGIPILLDGVLTGQGALRNLPVDAVSFVDVLRWTDSSVYWGLGDVVAVYTRSVDDSRPVARETPGIIRLTWPGYYQAREFYSPKYDIPSPDHTQDDYRTTLFWEPEIKPGDDGKATISFFTSDKASVYRVLVEGITETGIPVVQTKEFWVQ